MDGDLRPFTIVGIVGDVREYGIGTLPKPTFYADHRQRPGTASVFHVAARGPLDLAALAAAARRVLTELDPEVPAAFRPLGEVVSGSLADRRFVLLLLALFGGLALVLATMGIYSVIAYLAVQRTPEIGVRIALGARGRDVVRLIVRQSVAFAAAGYRCGFGGGVRFEGRARGFPLWRRRGRPGDLHGYSGRAAVSGSRAAHRASRVDVVEALRHG